MPIPLDLLPKRPCIFANIFFPYQEVTTRRRRRNLALGGKKSNTYILPIT
jgi:hypothetical protein